MAFEQFEGEGATQTATLGNSARVSLSPTTVDIAQASLRPEKKRELRRAAIIAYIKSRPYGARIKMEEFQQIGSFATNANADQFVKGMVKHRLIKRENITPRTYAYYVPDGAEHKLKITRPATTRFTVEHLERKAMEYSWHHSEATALLHEFVDWMQSQTNTEDQQ
jgi:hypothetical protein